MIFALIHSYSIFSYKIRALSTGSCQRQLSKGQIESEVRDIVFDDEEISFKDTVIVLSLMPSSVAIVL